MASSFCKTIHTALIGFAESSERTGRFLTAARAFELAGRYSRAANCIESLVLKGAKDIELGHTSRQKSSRTRDAAINCYLRLASKADVLGRQEERRAYLLRAVALSTCRDISRMDISRPDYGTYFENVVAICGFCPPRVADALIESLSDSELINGAMLSRGTFANRAARVALRRCDATGSWAVFLHCDSPEISYYISEAYHWLPI